MEKKATNGDTIESRVAAVRRYADGLWWVMHHSYTPGRALYALASYLDDSGSDDLSPLTTTGGPIMSRDAFLDFVPKWERLLYEYRVPPPLHMKDFVRPYGKHVGMYPEMKLGLFRKVAKLVNEHKLYSLSVAVPGPEFDALLSDEVRKNLIGPYALAFFAAALAIHEFSSHSRLMHAEITSVMVDMGFGHPEQLVKAHAAILKAMCENGQPCFIGAFGQDTDDRVPALQAADAIAWSARRKEIGRLTEEFEPLNALLDYHHTAIPIPKDGIEMFAAPIQNWLTKRGRLPELQELVG